MKFSACWDTMTACSVQKHSGDDHENDSHPAAWEVQRWWQCLCCWLVLWPPLLHSLTTTIARTHACQWAPWPPPWSCRYIVYIHHVINNIIWIWMIVPLGVTLVDMVSWLGPGRHSDTCGFTPAVHYCHLIPSDYPHVHLFLHHSPSIKWIVALLKQYLYT